MCCSAFAFVLSRLGANRARPNRFCALGENYSMRSREKYHSLSGAYQMAMLQRVRIQKAVERGEI